MLRACLLTSTRLRTTPLFAARRIQSLTAPKPWRYRPGRMGSLSGGETSRYFAAGLEGPRRSTRLSLARYSYGNDDPTESDAESSAEFTLGSDIEDAVTAGPSLRRRRPPLATKLNGSTTRKRKRAETTEAPTLIKKDEEDLLLETKTLPDTSPAKARRERKPARAKTDPTTGTTTVEPPSDWEEMYALVKEMRLTGPAANAAVDTMGCERLATAEASPRDRRFHTLIALMLSSQTKDTVNAAAMARLKAELPPYREGAPPGLNLENILAVQPAVLNEMIYPVGFHNNKTKYIKQAAEILRDKWSGDIPNTIEGLTSLPGVGPKMAHLCMSAPNGWNRVEGIGVDVHVHRITNMWGWNKTANPEATRAALESWLPRDRWREVNWLLVGFGQSVCLPVGKRCGDCELGARGLCRAADRKKVAEGRRRREVAEAMYGGGKLEDDEGKVKVEAEVKTGVVKVDMEGTVDSGVAAAVVKKEEVIEEEKVYIKQELEHSPPSRPAKRRTGPRELE